MSVKNFLLAGILALILGINVGADPDAVAATHYRSIPAAAFTPGEPLLDYENHGRYQFLYNTGVPFSSTGTFVAPLQLPQGAHLTRFTFYFRDISLLSKATASISYNQHFSSPNLFMTPVESAEIWGGGQFGSVSTTNFLGPNPIDNMNYQYFVSVTLPVGGEVWNLGVTVEYTLPPQPLGPGARSVPASSFIPFEDGYTTNTLGSLTHTTGPGGLNSRGWYLSPLNLPDLAVITNLSFYWGRGSTANTTGIARLQRTQLGADNFEDLAVLSSAAGAGGFLSYDSTQVIQNSLVDNSLYAYWLVYDLPAYNFPNQPVVAFDTVIQFQPLAVSRPIISIPAAAFRPYEDGYDFENHARHLIHKHGPGNSLANGWYLGPLHLPDGVSIKRLTFHWDENTTVPGVARLQRTRLGTGNYEELGTVFTSTGSNAIGSGSDSTILGGPVDNSRYAYWIVWDLPANATIVNNVRGLAVQVEYDFLLFLPLIRK
jgi:hypothetical protein